MRSKVSELEVRSRIGSILEDVRLRGTTYIIERDGRPAAAVVPMALLERLDRERDAAFKRIDGLRERIAERVPADEFDESVTDELLALRASRRGKQART